MMSWWHGLSMLGSLAVTGPVGVAIAVWLLAGKSWRLTLSWCLLFGAGMALVVLTKVAFIGWGVGIAAVEFGGFSGHAMRAAAVFPVACYLATRHASPQWRHAAVGAGVLLALLIGISRLPVLAHSVSEVVTGGLLGLGVAAAFIWIAKTERHVVFGRVLAALCIPVLLIAPHAEPIPTEQWMTELALFLSGRDKPFTRKQWKVQPPQSEARAGSF
ncbi:MAG: phosphatase PAP2 family protein [Pseudomonadota bacterium]